MADRRISSTEAEGLVETFARRKARRFIGELNSSIRRLVIRRGITYEEAVDMALTQEEENQKYRTEKEQENSSKGKTNHPAPTHKNDQPCKYQKGRDGNRGATLTANRGKEVAKVLVRCFNCGGTRHMSSTCSQPRRPFNHVQLRESETYGQPM
ncbi:hypothetical protein M0R45_015972 [Rubus argutus]|uniref:CCHC-type domain-containing protein n=1 Tax=Rubus argutus TaxID=59490 RepID=A0AAW1XTP4_RUBAR